MPGELGTCPTCKNPVSTTAQSCPNCGEVAFYADIEDQEKPVIVCHSCNGTRICNGKTCYMCDGTGALQGIIFRQDMRTYKGKIVIRNDNISRPWPKAWGMPPSPKSSGCAIIVFALLSLTAVGMVAFLF